MKSPKLLRLEKEIAPECLRLEAQTLRAHEELERLRGLLRRTLKPVEIQANKEAKYRLPFKNGQSFALRDVSEYWDTRYCETLYISPGEAGKSILYIMRGTERLYVLPSPLPCTLAPIVEEAATRVLEADGYRFIPCTWLDAHHVRVHWPEDLK